MMTISLVISFLLSALMGASARGSETEFWSHLPAKPLKVGLVTNGSDPAPAEATPVESSPAEPTPAEATSDDSNACTGVTFSRGLKYGENDLNVVDVATGEPKEASSRPVLMVVEGKSFAGDNSVPDAVGQMRDAAICFAARNGMVGVKVTYRLAPANPWPAGAKDVAAAISWVHDNIDLFGGRSDEVVLIGHSAGAFHVASYMAHPELREPDPGVAGVVLVSGLYSPGADASAAEKSYFGDDLSKYKDRSAFPGILSVEAPIVLAWAEADPPGLAAQGEKLKAQLCNAGHCPRTIMLSGSDGLSSALDAPNKGLAAPIEELIRELESRGLP
jgi:acetyl esterase/lipase